MTSPHTFKKISTLLVTCFLFGAMSAQALTISPASDEIGGNPGDTVSRSFLLINEQSSDQTFYTSVENFESSGETGTPNFVPSKEGLASWIRITEKVTLKKGERINVPYQVMVPSNADAGGHFAAIFLSTVPPPKQDGESVSVGAKVGMLVLLKVSGDTKENGGLVSFNILENKKVLTSLPVNFEYRFKNDGNNYVRPEGDIVIKNMFGMESGRVSANKSGNVLPSSTRKFKVRYGEIDAPAVSAPFFTQVKFQWNNFALGAYFADINLTFGDSGKVSSSLTYFIFPWQLLSVIIGVVLLVVILFMTLVKRYNKWIIKQARAAK